MKRIAIAGILASALATAYASAPEPIENYDPLHTPAPQAQRADRGLITGILQQGEQFIAVGGFGTIIEFSDPAQWQQRQVPTSVLLTAINAVDDEHIWVAGHDGVLLQSTDGGQTWHIRLDGHQLLELEYEWLQVRQAELEDAIENAEDEFEAEELEFELDELFFHIGGAEIQFDVGPTKPFLDVHFFNRDVGLAVGAYGTILRTTDGGANWSVKNGAIDNIVGNHINKLVEGPDGELILVGEAGLLARSDDQGETFEMLDSPYHGSLFGALFDDLGQLWIYGLRGNVFVSADGYDFEQVDTNTRYNLNAGTLLNDGRVVLAGHSGTLLVIDPATRALLRFEHESSSPLAGVRQTADHQLILIGRSGLLTFTLPAVTAMRGN